jgi:hypothetical protein
MGFFAFASGAAQNGPAVTSRTGVPVRTAPNASFAQVANVGGIAGSRFYLYLPSEIIDANLTPVIYVYGDKPYSDGNAAWSALAAAGLDTIAEAEHTAIIMLNPVGFSWGKNDIDVFEATMNYISAFGGEVPLTSHNLQYVIGEESGATFVNNYLTQNCKRIAAVMTFGGEIDNPTPRYALPAYIVSGSQKAVDFYLNANDGTRMLPISGRVRETVALRKSYWKTTEAGDKATHVYTANPIKKVIVNKSGAAILDAALIADCWEALFRYTSRPDLVTNAFQYSATVYNDAEYTLLPRPNYKAAGMQVIRVDGINNGIFDSSPNNFWYEFVPRAAQEAMARGSTEKFPMIVDFHGGGIYPLFSAEGGGWSQLAIDKNIIIVSPNLTPNDAKSNEEVMALIDYMIKKYPVDISCIYAEGFSQGSESTLSVSNAYPERFAAVVPMSRTNGPFYTDLVVNTSTYSYDIDLPVCVAGQGIETESTDANGRYVWFDAVKGIYTLNEVPQYTGALDYVKYPYWGFPIEDEVRHDPPAGFAIWQGYKYDANGVPIVSFVHTDQTAHVLYPEYAPILWEWLSRFSRDPQTKAVVYNMEFVR